MNKNNRKKIKVWECKNCGHIIEEQIYYSHRFDYGCPKCKKSFYQYYSRKI